MYESKPTSCLILAILFIAPLQNSEGHLLAKLTAFPLEALRILAVHFEARFKDVLVAVVDDVLRAWKSGHLDALVGEGKTCSTLKDSSFGSEGDTNGLMVAHERPSNPPLTSNALTTEAERPKQKQQQNERLRLASLDDDFPKLPSPATALGHVAPTASPTASITAPDLPKSTPPVVAPASTAAPGSPPPMTGVSLTQTRSSSSSSASTSHAIPVSTTPASSALPPSAPVISPSGDEIFMSEDEEEAIDTAVILPGSDSPPALAGSLSQPRRRISSTNEDSPVLGLDAAMGLASPTTFCADEIASLRRQLAEKQEHQAALLDQMVSPTESDGSLDSIIQNVTRLNIELEEIHQRLAAALKASSTSASAWGSGGDGPFVDGRPAGTLASSLHGAAGAMTTTTATATMPDFHAYSPFATPVFPPVLPASGFSAGNATAAPTSTSAFSAPSNGVFPSSPVSLFPENSLFPSFGGGLLPAASLPRQPFPSTGLSPFAPFSTAASNGSESDAVTSSSAIGQTNGFGAIGAAVTRGAGGGGDDALGSLLRSPMLNDVGAVGAAPASLIGDPIIKDSDPGAAAFGGGLFGALPAANPSPFGGQLGGLFGGLGGGSGGGGVALGGASLAGGFGGPFSASPFAPGPGELRRGDSIGATSSSFSAVGMGSVEGGAASTLDISGSKLLPQIVAANRGRGEEAGEATVTAKSVLDGFKNLNF